MKKAKTEKEPDMLPEYDFSKGARGKYAKRYAGGANVVVLSPDVAKAFPTSEAVNKALRTLVRTGRRQKLSRDATFLALIESSTVRHEREGGITNQALREQLGHRRPKSSARVRRKK